MRDNLEHVLSEIHIGVTGKGTYFTVTMAVKQALYCVGWLSPCIHTVDDGLIDFFNGWSSSGSTSRATTSTLIHLGDDWCADLFQFLLLVLEFVLFGGLVVIQPLDGFVTSITNGLDFIG